MVGIFEGKNDIGKTAIQGLKEYYLLNGEVMSQDFVDLYSEYILKEEIVHEERLLHSAFVERPRFWQVFPDMGRSRIEDMGTIKGYVYYDEVGLEKIPQKVEWLQDEKQVYKSDYYNQYGYPYCSRYYNEEGNKAFDIYYLKEHQELIQINHTNSSIMLYQGSQVYRMYSHVIFLMGDIFRRILQTEELYTNSEYVLRQLMGDKTAFPVCLSDNRLFELAEELQIFAKKLEA